jgi:hypothetical protein
MRTIAAYLRRHHIGLLALFIALGGTAYAVQRAPRDSVISKSIKDGQVRPRDQKLTKTIEYPATVSVSTGSPAPQEPFTVRVPESGMVSIYAESEISKTNGQTQYPCNVSLSLDGDPPYTPILSIGFDLNGFEIRRTAPNGDNAGVFTRTQAGFLSFPTQPGRQTFRIQYSGPLPNTNCQFRNTKLVIIPLP